MALIRWLTTLDLYPTIQVVIFTGESTLERNPGSAGGGVKICLVIQGKGHALFASDACQTGEPTSFQGFYGFYDGEVSGVEAGRVEIGAVGA